MRHTALPVLICTTLSLSCGAAQARNLDYQGLENFFGEPVTTSATGAPQRVSEVPASMIIISAEQIGHAAAVDIPGILREYTDLDVLQFARGDTEVSVRGYDRDVSSRLLVLINGRQVYLDNRGFTDWQSLPIQLSEIRQIEVVKGPNSALFGFNASGGVVNIVTVNPLYDAVNTAAVRVGSDGYQEASAVGTASLGATGGVRLSANGTNSSAYHTDTPWETPGSLTSVRQWNEGNEKRNANLDGVFALGDNLQGRVEASHSQNARVLFFDDGFSYDVHTVVDSAKATVTADTRFGQIDATVYTNIGDMNDGIGDDFQSVLTVANLQGLFKVGPDNAFRVATEYRYTSMNTVPLKGSQVYYSDYSLSGMWDWAVSPRWTVTNALRLDHQQVGRSGMPPLNAAQSNGDYSGRANDAVSGNSNITHKLTDLDTLRLSFGRGVESPSLTTYGLQQAAPGALPNGVFSGNPDLKPTVVTNYELAYSRDLPGWPSKFTSAVFYQTSENLISFGDLSVNDLFTTLQPITYVNIGSSTAEGLEAGLDGHGARGMRWGVKYRFETIHEKLSVDTTSNNYNVDYAGSAPHQMLTGNLGWTLGQWDFDLFSRASTSYSMRQAAADGSYPPYAVAGYVSADARIAYHVTSNMSLAASVTDMQRQTTRYTVGQTVPRQFFGTLNVTF